MTIILKKGQRLEEILPKGKSVKPAKKLNSNKYVAVSNLKVAPIEI